MMSAARPMTSPHARTQFGFTAASDILFAAFSLGLASFLTVRAVKAWRGERARRIIVESAAANTPITGASPRPDTGHHRTAATVGFMARGNLR
jgi:hypothetical protein